MSGSTDASAVIRRTCGMYLGQRRVWLPAAAAVFGVAGVLDAVLVAVSRDLVYLSFLIVDVAIALFTGMVVRLVAAVEAGRRDTSSGELLLAVRPVFGDLVLVGIVAGVGVFLGFILLIVPGLFLATIWSVAAPVVVMERPGRLRALGRSRELVRGHGWQVLGVVFVMVFVVGLLTSGVDIAADSVGADVGVAIRVITGIVATPLSAFAAAVLYLELRGASSAGSADDSADGPSVGRFAEATSGRPNRPK
jgi:hypothetical protein